MILIANQADFSQNNLGQVDLAYSDLTLAVLAKFTKVLTDPQKKALNTLLLKLEGTGILSKQKHFYLPILAGALNESFINIADPTLPTEITPNASHYVLTSGGIKNNSSGGSNLQLTMKTGMATNDFHILQFNTETLTAATDAMIVYGDLYGSAFVVLTNLEFNAGDLIIGSNFNLMNQSPNIYDRVPGGSNSHLNIGVNKSLKGWSFLQTDKLKCYSPTEKEVSLSPSYTAQAMVGGINLTGAGNNSMLKSHGLITIGKGLTAAEITILSNAANNLMTEMGVVL